MKFHTITSSGKTLLGACVLFITFGTTAAWGEDLSVAVRISTLGPGIELKYRFHDKFNARLVTNQFTTSDDAEFDDTDYDIDLDVNTYGLIGDWHPTGGGFRLSVGAIQNGSSIKAGTSGTYEFGDSDIMYDGAANVKVDFKSIVPYLGLGYSSQKAKGFGFDFEIGVLFQDAPLVSASGNSEDCNFTINDGGVAKVTLVAGSSNTCVTGEGTATPEKFETDLEAEHRGIRDDLGDLLYPVISLGIQYRF